ncbi:acyltransferase 3 [Methylobacterium sp. 4-46]|nr:acyltransferase 3 [Methylobacterium sp. 4-46]
MEAPVPSTPPGPLPYLAPIDGLRALAMAAVLASHLPCPDVPPALAVPWHLANEAWVGTVAVDVFFVLSGFLITRILLRQILLTGRVDLGRFYLNRALRIVPAYYVCLLVATLLVRHVSPYTVSALTYTLNYYQPLHPASFTMEHAWSLAVEEQFYLVWPLLLALVPLAWVRWLTRAVLPGIAVLAAVALAESLPAELSAELIYKSLPTRMLSLSLGAWIAFREAEGRSASGLSCLATVAAGIATMGLGLLGRRLGYVPAGGWYWCPTLVGCALLSYGIVAHLAVGRPASWLSGLLAAAPLRSLGRISYGTYLYHLVVIYALGVHEAQLGGRVPAGLTVATALGLSLALGALSHRLVERPFLQLRDAAWRLPSPRRLRPGRPGPAA